MSQASRIEWTEATWNPTVGCTKISPGCKHCYAESMAKRLKAMGTPGYENGFKLTHPARSPGGAARAQKADGLLRQLDVATSSTKVWTTTTSRRSST